MFDNFYQTVRERLHLPPGLVVLLVVLVLLYGIGGAITAIASMALTLLAAIVSGGDHDAIASVLWRTLPLALASAGVTFAACNDWLKLDSLHSYVWMALIVLSGAVLGNACYERTGSQVVAIVDPTAKQTTEAQPIGLPTYPDTDGRPAWALEPRHIADVAAAPPAPTAWKRLCEINWLQQPDLHREPSPVEPLRIVPKGTGIFGSVGGAINQLLGYLVDYEPRLFLASIIAGSFMGWRLQRHVAIAHAVVSGDFSALSEREAKRLAA